MTCHCFLPSFFWRNGEFRSRTKKLDGRTWRLCDVQTFASRRRGTSNEADRLIEMAPVRDRAITILREYYRAEEELVGRAVVLTDGKAGTVESVTLDEVHGLRLSIAGHPGAWPVSTIKFLGR
jgi:hypothetical protein